MTAASMEVWEVMAAVKTAAAEAEATVARARVGAVVVVAQAAVVKAQAEMGMVAEADLVQARVVVTQSTVQTRRDHDSRTRKTRRAGWSPLGHPLQSSPRRRQAGPRSARCFGRVDQCSMASTRRCRMGMRALAASAEWQARCLRERCGSTFQAVRSFVDRDQVASSRRADGSAPPNRDLTAHMTRWYN